MLRNSTCTLSLGNLRRTWSELSMQTHSLVYIGTQCHPYVLINPGELALSMLQERGGDGERVEHDEVKVHYDVE